MQLARYPLVVREPLVEPVQTAGEAPEHLHDRVGQVFVVQVDRVDALARADDDAPRHADDRAVRRHVVDNDRTATHLATSPDRDVAEHGCADANDHAVFQRRVTLTGLLACSAEGDPLIQRDVVADDGGLADHNAHPMVDEEAQADGGSGVDLDSGQPACDLREEAREPMSPMAPEPVVRAMGPQRVQSGVVEQHAERRRRRRIALAHRSNVFTSAVKHP